MLPAARACRSDVPRPRQRRPAAARAPSPPLPAHPPSCLHGLWGAARWRAAHPPGHRSLRSRCCWAARLLAAPGALAQRLRCPGPSRGRQRPENAPGVQPAAGLVWTRCAGLMRQHPRAAPAQATLPYECGLLEALSRVVFRHRQAPILFTRPSTGSQSYDHSQNNAHR